MPISLRRLREIIRTTGAEFTLDDVISKVNLSRATAKRYVNEMIKRGFIVSFDGKYILTEKGFLVLEGEVVGKKTVEDNVAYIFTDENGIPIPLRINCVEKLYIVIKYGLIPIEVVQLHIEKGYLAKWLSDVVNAKTLAKKLESVKSVNELSELLEEYLGVK